ncbi:hypothetical protein HAX54_041599, partial [Datura stramonium]|nr:hypothetical protein [Datura stramonium]
MGRLGVPRGSLSYVSIRVYARVMIVMQITLNIIAQFLILQSRLLSRTQPVIIKFTQLNKPVNYCKRERWFESQTESVRGELALESWPLTERNFHRSFAVRVGVDVTDQALLSLHGDVRCLSLPEIVEDAD